MSVSEGINARNNPLNIKYEPGKTWKGATGHDGRGHVIFTHPWEGVRAGMRTLEAKWNNGKRTLAEIISSWAPADDTVGSLPGAEANDPEGYAASVARRVGIEVRDELPDLREDLELWARIVREMSRWENGVYCPWVTIYRGIILWWDDFAGREQ